MATFKGLIYLARNKRFYGINYTLNEWLSKTQLTIIDLARPTSITMSNIVKLDTGNEFDEKWLRTQVAEITAFKETLRGLQERGDSVLVNKLDFRERSGCVGKKPRIRLELQLGLDKVKP